MEYLKNQELEVTITDMGIDGEGIGKINGYPFFVKDALPGDRVRIKVIKVKKNFAYGRLMEILVKSPDRVEAPCSINRQCGGCQIQALSYEAQLRFKQNKVINNLVRIGGIDEAYLLKITEPIVGMDEPFRYRNKSQYPIGRDREGNIVAGFYAGRTHSIIACEDCRLGAKENSVILKCIIDYMNRNLISPYDEVTSDGIVRHVLIRKGFSSGEIMVCLVVNMKKGMPQKIDELVNSLTAISGVVSIYINYNSAKTNVILGDKCRCIYGKEVIRDTMFVKDSKSGFTENINQGLEYEISPLSFYQINPYQVERLYGIAVEYAGLTGSEEVWDLCCGIGTITLSMASRAKRVHGIEIVEAAIADAKKNAVRNNVKNVDFVCAAVEDYLPAHKDEIQADVVVMDPPRKGVDERALNVVVDARPEKIVYVSCDSATLARDVKYLCANGYELKRVRAVDMFGQTVHVETVVLLTRQNPELHLELEIDTETFDFSKVKRKVTYQEIKKYIEVKTGQKIHSAYIAQVKDAYGLKEQENHRPSKKEGYESAKCPQDKWLLIEEALRHFNLIE